MLLALLLLSYVWRFHDLSGAVASLRLAAIGTVASWAVLVFGSRGDHLKALFTGPGVLPLVLGVLWSGATVPLALSSEVAWGTWWEDHFKTFTMLLFLLTCFTSLESVKRAMAVHILGASVLAFYYAKGGFPLWGTPVSMFDVADVAMHLNMTAPFILFFATVASGRWLRIGLWSLLGFLTVCVLMTQSRGGFLTIGVFASLILLSATGIRLWLRLLPPILVICTFLLAPPETKAKLATLFNPMEDYNVDQETGRFEIWKRGLGYLQTYPVTGVGIANFELADQILAPQAAGGRLNWRGKSPHNIFVEVAIETGIPGLLLFVSALLSTSVHLLRVRAAARHHLNSIPAAREFAMGAEALLLSLVAYVVGGTFLSMGYAPILYSLVAMSVGWGLIVSRELRALAKTGRVRHA